MNMATKKDIFSEQLEEYLKAKKKRKGEILTHVCFVTELHRKAAVRKFAHLQMKGTVPLGRRGRRVIYGPQVTAALRTVWEAGNEVCGELLHAVVAEYVDILIRDKMWKHVPDATEKLRAMSEGTMKRRVALFMRIRRGHKGISSTKPSHLKHIVPIFTGPWKDKMPGFGQLDSVRHSDSAYGDAVYTINYTDATALFVIPRAQLNKGEQATVASVEAIQETMPVKLRGLHPDSGSEFLNWFLKDWCDHETVELTRSRPNRKNDNMYVEERNGHVIRKVVGYMRLDCVAAVAALNELYDVLTPYLLHFVAVRRMTGKQKIKSKYVRQYEPKAKTPYARILEHSAVPDFVKAALKKEHEKLNPLILKREIDRRIKKVYATQQRYGNPRKPG
jgi:hypothetical protein